MPYKYPSNIPTTVKNLPVGAIKLFIRVFNAVETETKDEDQARKAAWAQVKGKYKKEGDKWVRKTSAKENVEKDSIYDFCSLQEAEFDDDSKTATVTIIREGWSKNKTNGKRRYYTGKAVESVATLLNDSKKMYKDHTEKNRVRYIDEWAATVTKSWVKEVDGKKHAKATIDFTENPKTVWLYKESKKHPEEVGISIDGGGEIREGKIGNDDAAIVENVKILNSADFVSMAAAGGVVEKINEAVANKTVDVLSEVFKSLEDRINTMKAQDKPYQDRDYAMSALQQLISDLMYSNEISSGDVEDEIDSALDTFSDTIKQVINDIRSKWEQKEHVEREDKMKLDEFKKEHPDAYAELSEQIDLLAKNEAEKAVKAEVEKTKSELEIAQNALKEANEKAEKIEKELTEVKQENETYKANEAQAKKKELINQKLAEAKVEGTEKFVALLMKLEEAEIVEQIADRAALIADQEGKIKGLGAKKETKKEDKPVFDEEKAKKLLYN